MPVRALTPLMRAGRGRALTLLVLAPMLLQAGPAWADRDCPAATAAAIAAPQSRRVVEAGAPLIVVALGSSSTYGAIASDPAHSYPAVLQRSLAAALPSAHVAVLNRGVNGQDAGDQLARIEPDVIAAHPSLVIWQAGANSAIRRIDPALFKQQLVAGVARLHNAGADVVLMDNQLAPAILTAPGHAAIDQVLAEAAAETGAGLFSRGGLMRAWESGGDSPALFLAPDGLHHNDRGYRCVAQALSAALVDGMSAARTINATAGRR